MNSDEISNISKEIISLSNDLMIEFNNLFQRFSEVPDVTREWVGMQALFYFNRVSLDKAQYIDFVNSLRDIGHRLNRNAMEIEHCLKKNSNLES